MTAVTTKTLKLLVVMVTNVWEVMMIGFVFVIKWAGNMMQITNQSA